MKKFLALFMVCAMALTLSADNTLFFNRGQFQPSKITAATDAAARPYELTVPMVYKGSVSFKGWYATDNDKLVLESAVAGDADCVVSDKAKGSFPMYMTLCQPCIDCYPCTKLGADQTTDGAAGWVTGTTAPSAYNFYTAGKYGTAAEVGYITRWNVYVIAKGHEATIIYKLNMLDAAALTNPDGAAFFTGASGKLAYVSYGVYSASDNHMAFTLTGKKSDYKFKFTEAYLTKITDGVATWAKQSATDTAYIKSVTSFAGPVCLSNVFNDTVPAIGVADGYKLNGFQFCGTIKLTRNASLTKKAISSTFTTTTTTYGKHWEDCSETNPAGYCEAYLNRYTATTLDTAILSTVQDSFDTYLLKTYKNSAMVTTYGLDTIVDALAGL